MDEELKQRHKRVIEDLANYQARGGLPEGLERVLALETDRALVTILGSYIEDALLDRIMAELPYGAANRKALLKGGPLRSVEHRIALASSLGILNEWSAARLNVFRAMRNACAHSRLDIDFDTPELRAALAVLLPDHIGDAVIAGTNEGTLRGLFVASVTLTLNVLRGYDKDEIAALAKAATDEQGDVHADKVLLATLRGTPRSKSAPDQSQDQKG